MYQEDEKKVVPLAWMTTSKRQRSDAGGVCVWVEFRSEGVDSDRRLVDIFNPLSRDIERMFAGKMMFHRAASKLCCGCLALKRTRVNRGRTADGMSTYRHRFAFHLPSHIVLLTVEPSWYCQGVMESETHRRKYSSLTCPLTCLSRSERFAN